MTRSTNSKARCYPRLCLKRSEGSNALPARTALDPHNAAKRRTEQSHVPISPRQFIASGIALIFIVLFLEHSPAIAPHIPVVIFELGKHIGVAFVVLGVISFGLEVPHWTEYFKDRLAAVVIDHEYLDKMSVPQLQELQLETWKRLFRGAQIRREGSFLEFFEKRIQNLIGDPYREAAVEQMIITDSGDPDKYNYTTIVTYKCRQVHAKLQRDVTWAPAFREFLEVQRVTVKLLLPPDSIIRENLHLKNQAWHSDQESDAQPAYHSDTRTYEFTSDKLMKYYRDPNNKRKVSVPLDQFFGYDGLTVTITGEGTIPTTGFIGWGMSHPTKGFVLMCEPPPGKYARHELFGIDNKDVRRTDAPDKTPECQDRLTLICDTWVMPNAGIAICFQPKCVSSLNEDM